MSPESRAKTLSHAVDAAFCHVGGINGYEEPAEILLMAIASAIRDAENEARESEWRAILTDVQDLPALGHEKAGVVLCANSVEDTIIGPTKRRPPNLKSKGT